MRKLIVSEFISLHGVIQARGGVDEDVEGGFARGGWTMPYWHDAIGENFDALYVVSRTLETPIWRNTTIIRSDVVEAVKKLKAAPGKNILTPTSVHTTFKLLEAKPYPSGVVGLHYERA